MRKSIVRSRNGCAVCKSKRLKCDEARPSCSRCERLGIPCPGYQKPLKWTRSSRASQERNYGVESRPSGQQQIGSPPQQSPQPILQTPVSQDYSPPGFLDQLDDIFDTGSLDFYDNDNIDSPFSLAPPSDETPHHYQVDQVDQVDLISREESRSQRRDALWTDIFSPTASKDSELVQYQGNSMPLPPRAHETSVPHILRDHSSVLVEYYFKEVCGLMSCYDSPMNPYRTQISNIWTRSKPLYYITQSMAAACLSEVSPNMSLAGRQLRDEAISCLTLEATTGNTDTASLLAVVMLGMSLCWHDPSNIGQSEYQILAKSVFSTDDFQNNASLAERQKHFFFYNSLVYWRLLLSFVTDLNLETTASSSSRTRIAESTAVENYEPRVPHPQTGVGIEIQELVSQVGALIRRERKRIRSRRYASREDIGKAEAAIQEATRLHSSLCSILLPKEATVIDSGDDITPASHLLKVAEAYRCMGLLQLYRNFPDLLLFSVDRDLGEQVSPRGTEVYTRGGDDNLADTWLTCLALHILDLVQNIPVSSRSRSIQPLLLVAICSELSLSRPYCELVNPSNIYVESITSSPIFRSTPGLTEILHARRNVVSRLSYFENVLAAKPVRRMIQLVKETWSQMDQNQQDTYWMDVMMDEGYETLMG